MKTRFTSQTKAGPIKALVYGRSGAGKTSLAKTLPGSTLIISAESGLLSLADIHLPYLSVSDTEDSSGNLVSIPKGIERAKRLGEILEWLESNPEARKYDNIFVDSITEIAENLVDTFKAIHGSDSKKDGFKIWGDYSEKLIAIIKRFRDLPHFNVVLVALEDADKDDQNKKLFGPDVPGNAAKKFLMPAFDLVFRLSVAPNGVRYFVTDSTDREQAKHRGCKLEPQEINNGDLGAIFSKIRQTQSFATPHSEESLGRNEHVL